MCKIKKRYLFLLLVFLTFGGVCAHVPFYLASPLVREGGVEEKEFVVESGESFKSVIKRLKEERLIRSELYALFYAKWKKHKVKTGIYDFSPKLSTNEMIRRLAKGGREEFVKVTVPEGLTIKKTARVFEKAGVCRAEEFVDIATKRANVLKEYGLDFTNAEGFLFPDTYLLSKKDNAESVIKMMVKNFFAKAKTVNNFPKDTKAIYDVVKLASIIEREYQLDSEAPTISGVFTNRLRINMPLQSCATVEYIITEIEGKPHPKRLFWEDIQVQNEYNTYINYGLPPTPIASVGLVSLSAACNPEKTNYLYFRLIDPKIGKHAFSTNVADHNKIGNVHLLK